jgi:hypothetical protein
MDAGAEDVVTVFLPESTLHCLLSTQRRPSTASPPYHLKPTMRPSSQLSTLGVRRRSDTDHATTSPHQIRPGRGLAPQHAYTHTFMHAQHSRDLVT